MILISCVSVNTGSQSPANASIQGVALAVTSLVSALAQDFPDEMALCYQKAANRLNKIVIKQEFGSDYIYYRVPIPWLQVKLLRLLQYYPPSGRVHLVLLWLLQAEIEH